MVSAFARRAGPLLAVGLGLIIFTSSAAAAPSNPFGCRASVSATRPIAPAPAVEPYVANAPETPCVTDSAGTNGTTGSSADGGSAYTYSTSSADPSTGAVAPGATALATSNGSSNDAGGDSVVIAGPAQAQASYACVNNSPSATGTSDVTAADVNGQMVRPVSPGAAETTQLGNGSYVTINQQIQTPTSLTERLVFEHIAGVGDFVTGEAQVTLAAGNPCAGTSGLIGGSGSGSSGSGSSGSGSSGSGSSLLQACPTGSVLVASAGLCEIVSPGQANIVVGSPFAGPTGGSVMSLAAARKKYKSSCLSGKGPKFAVVGTNGANRISAGNQAERILGLGGNDRISAKNGADCIDGGAGNDRISVGNGSDRVFGGTGNDHITAGKGSDRITGGAGNDTITAGSGKDWIWGSAGKDNLKVGKGKDHLYGGAGNDRLYDPGKVAYVNGGSGRNVAFVTAPAMKYARKHGCQTVRRIRTRA